MSVEPFGPLPFEDGKRIEQSVLDLYLYFVFLLRRSSDLSVGSPLIRDRTGYTHPCVHGQQARIGRRFTAGEVRAKRSFLSRRLPVNTATPYFAPEPARLVLKHLLNLYAFYTILHDFKHCLC